MPFAIFKERIHMITVSIKGVLIGVLLIALIVLVVFLIVLVSNATDTIKKANAIIDGGTAAAQGAKEKVDSINETIKENTSKVTGMAKTGVDMGLGIVNRILK
jgi:predicted PurR-regulated permease PerM